MSIDTNDAVLVELYKGIDRFIIEPGLKEAFEFIVPSKRTFSCETRSELDTKMAVYDQDLKRIGKTDDDPGPGKNARITVKDAKPGKYFLEVWFDNESDTGPYRVLIYEGGADVVGD